jgi:hypothetical protein
MFIAPCETYFTAHQTVHRKKVTYEDSLYLLLFYINSFKIDISQHETRTDGLKGQGLSLNLCKCNLFILHVLGWCLHGTSAYFNLQI